MILTAMSYSHGQSANGKLRYKVNCGNGQLR